MSVSEEFGLTIETPEQALAHIVGRIDDIMEEVERSEVWRAVASEGASPDLSAATLREIYLEIGMYQADAIEAAVAAIAQFPRTMPVAWFDEMLHHQVEEFDHGEMALRDYAAMGGDVEAARRRRQSPSAFAVAAIWRNIAHKRDPFVYLGAVYLFEALTPKVTARVKDLLAARLAKAKGLEFITHHATADLEHERQMRELMIDVMRRYPGGADAVVFGFEYFAHIYPLPVWRAALRRAERSIAHLQLAAE